MKPSHTKPLVVTPVNSSEGKTSPSRSARPGTLKELLAAKAKRSKYRAVRCEVDGQKFDSKREAQVWQSLRLLERAGEIRELKRQVPFDLSVNGERICRYVADFQWVENAPTTMKHIREFIVTADAKGVRTPVYKLKAKLMKAIHGIEIREL